MSEVLTRSLHEGVLTVTLNRPQKANALSLELLAALDTLTRELAEQAEAGDGPRALVITGAGQKAFSAGADVSELVGLDKDTAVQRMRNGQEIFGRLETLPMIVVAALNGVALGGGLELAMAADIRIAASSARLGQPEITLANLPGWGGTQRLPRLVGSGRALELITTGDLISADEAWRIGLVNRVVDDCLPAAQELAQRIGQNSRHAVAGAKHAVRVGVYEGLDAGLRAEAEAVGDCCQTAEQHQAVQNFLQRKAARS